MLFQERYQPGGSPLHQLDARVKVVVTLLLIPGILLTPERTWIAYPLIWLLLAALAERGQVGALRVSRRALVALPFALAALTVAFTTPGQPLFSTLGLTVTDAGLGRFAAIVLKSWLAAHAAALLTMTTPFTDLLWALSSLRVPEPLVTIFAFTYRYLFTLGDEAERLMRARAARSGTMPGLKPRTNPVWHAQIAGGMIASLFVRSYERSERVYLAMRSRGYTGEMRRAQAAALTRRDLLTGAAPLVILLLIQWIALGSRTA